MKFLLDTNVCIALINNNLATVRTHFEKAVDAGATIYIPTVVGFELWFGAWNSDQQAS